MRLHLQGWEQRQDRALLTQLLPCPCPCPPHGGSCHHPVSRPTSHFSPPNPACANPQRVPSCPRSLSQICCQSSHVTPELFASSVQFPHLRFWLFSTLIHPTAFSPHKWLQSTPTLAQCSVLQTNKEAEREKQTGLWSKSATELGLGPRYPDPSQAWPPVWEVSHKGRLGPSTCYLKPSKPSGKEPCVRKNYVVNLFLSPPKESSLWN